MTDELNSSNPKTWFGEDKKVYGFFKTDGKTYCFLGNFNDFNGEKVEKAKQVSVKASLFSTEYEFSCGDSTLKVKFTSPLPLTDLSLLSLPVVYVDYSFSGKGEISFFINRNIAYNEHTAEKGAKALSVECEGYFLSAVGLKRQLPLSNNDDVVGADWGYYYLSGEKSFPLDVNAFNDYVYNNNAQYSINDDEIFIGSFNCKNNGFVMVGYDDRVSIDYFGDYLKGYYLSENTIFDAFNYVFSNKNEIDALLSEFESNLLKKADKYGTDYVDVLIAAYRQSVGAHKLVKDTDGNILFLSKECGSNGCIATVDVTYPSIPLFLLYNTDLVKGMLRPIFKFAKMPVWNYSFAPHDVGTYPACLGQVYGLNPEKNAIHGNFLRDGGFQTHFPLYLLPASFNAYDFSRQMPVEECANILITLYACCYYDKNASFFKSEMPLLKKWVDYLVKFGLKPEDQLCTDDFAGRLKNNINLAIKATVGIACYAKLLECVGENGDEFMNIAKSFADKISDLAKRIGHLPLTWDSGEDTYSLKYNFAFDKILGLGLFSEDVFKNEINYYKTKLNKFGIPLDNRKDYTKSDWLLWTAVLADDDDKKKYFIKPVRDFLVGSPSRVPFTDWYETTDGTAHEFKARTVQAGCFILLLLNR